MNFKKKKFNRNDNFNSKPKELGSFIHFCEDLVIVKVSNCDYIPYPNALVLNKDHKLIGKVEEVLGPQNEVYVAIKREIKEDYDLKSTFYCYENKFIPKERFMERSEVEKKKEEGDKNKSVKSSSRVKSNRGNFNKVKGDGYNKGKGDGYNKVKGDGCNKGKGDGYKRNFNDRKGFNDRKSFNDRKKQWNKK